MIALVYGNDLTGLGEAAFPILSRRMCELMGNICPSEYEKYCIDNHIWDIFKLLKQLGHDRFIYLHDVIFEHVDHLKTIQLRNKLYKDVLKKDIATFMLLRGERIRTAIRVAQYIEVMKTIDG
jgi:hypothetical protein